MANLKLGIYFTMGKYAKNQIHILTKDLYQVKQTWKFFFLI